MDELADRELSPPPEDEMNDRSESFDRANPIWNYFCQEDGDSKHVRCKLCDKEISRGLRWAGDKCVKRSKGEMDHDFVYFQLEIFLALN